MSEEKKEDGLKTSIFSFAYKGQNEVSTENNRTRVRLFGNLMSEKVDFEGKLIDPIGFREAMASLYSVVRSDYRYRPKDRQAYVEYLKLKSKTASKTHWEAQNAYFDWLKHNDPNAWLILDPIISVHPDEVFFEVFSKDESTYAKLSVDQKGWETRFTPSFGTTHIDFSERFFEEIESMRSTKDTFFRIVSEGVSLVKDKKIKVLEKRIHVPNSWIRGLLQIQQAAVLPSSTLHLSPIDFYNILRHLRLHKDQKGKKRGLRFELIPGEYPKVILEPFETVIHCHHFAYQGDRSQVIRIWGRRRLMLARRFLPFTEKIDVVLKGSGLPSFFILKGSHFSLTIGLSGFIASSWSSKTAFELKLPEHKHKDDNLTSVLSHLEAAYYDDIKGIERATGLNGAVLTTSLQAGCRKGLLIYDMVKKVYRLRPLFIGDFDHEPLTYQNKRDQYAHELVSRKGAVRITSENRIHGSGIELKGEVISLEDRRDYAVKLLVNEDGLVTSSECSCPFFHKHRMKKGPCPHQIAIWICYIKSLEVNMHDEKVRARITMETKTFTKRVKDRASHFQVTLDQKRLRIKRQDQNAPFRIQHILFNSTDEARAAYFNRIEQLESQGWLLAG